MEEVEKEAYGGTHSQIKRIIGCPTGTTGRKKVNDMEYCHYDYNDEEHDCLDYMECEECPYYYADMEG